MDVVASEGSDVDENGYFDTDKEKVDYLFFGLVDRLEIEVGYFSLSDFLKFAVRSFAD